MARFSSSTDPDAVRSWLGTSSDHARSDSNRLASAAAAIADLGNAAPWLTVEDFECDAAVGHLIALDVVNGRSRMAAIVYRAFQRANAYADLLAQRLEDRDFAASATGDLNGVLAMLVGEGQGPKADEFHIQLVKGDGVLQHSLDVIARFRTAEADAEDRERRDAAADVVDILSRFRTTLRAVARDGREADDARFFFLMCLGEAYALATGQTLHYHAFDPKRRRNDWQNLVANAFDIAGLSDTDLAGGSGKNLDTLLRKLGGKGGYALARYQADYEFDHLARCLGPKGGHRLKPLVLGDLPSTGHELDFRHRRDGAIDR